MSMHSPTHPIWSVIRLIVTMTALVLILWANAAEFDETELRTLFYMVFVAASSESMPALLRKFLKNDKDDG